MVVQLCVVVILQLFGGGGIEGVPLNSVHQNYTICLIRAE